ncbi:MAG: MFS transporter [Candidatus Lokiarchaeota archaeon]|nr:MFS transporter [Candidatus Lokiarchaeota archaeon]
MITIEPKFSEKKFEKRLIIIFIIQFTEVLGFSSVLPIIPFLGLSLGLNALEIGLILSIFSICQLFASPITGKLSDRYGRKPLLVFSQISTFIGFILLGLASNVWILIAARLVDGLLGSNMTVSQAYISDVTNPKYRTKTYGYSSAVFGAGLIFGPVIGGLLLSINFSAPFFFAAGICLLSIILVLILLPESLTRKEEKLEFNFGEIIPVKEAKYFVKSPPIRGLIIVFFVYNFGFMLFINTFPLFVEMQISATPQQVSFYMAWIGVLRVIFQSLLINPILKKISENNTLIIGIFTMIIAMSFLIFSISYWIVFFPLFFLAFGTGVARPILTSKLTKTVKREETGSLLGVNNSLTSIGQIITPILGGIVLQFLPTQILPISSAIIFTLIIILWKWMIISPNKEIQESTI